jgi:hypothetical protein
MRNNKQLMAVLALSGLIGVVQADEKDELLKLRNTTVNLIKQLVKQGVLTDKMAQDMIEQAEADAGKQVAQAKAASGKAAGGAAKTATSEAGNVAAAGEAAVTGVAGAAAKEAVPADEIRVSYVPDFVKDEIRQQVRTELREEVVGDVMQKAKDEQWGMPNALPDWVKRFTLSGDIRLREQSSYMGSDNIDNNPITSSGAYPNFNAINGVAGFSATPQINSAGTAVNQNAYLNTKQNQSLGRERFRLGIDAAVNDSVDAGIRLATGNTQNPVSTNQTLGNTGYGYQFAVDRAFLRYRAFDESKFNWLTVMGGRTPNPFFTGGSEMVWDEDLSFEGAAATLRQRLLAPNLSDEIGGKGPAVFATAGLFPLQAQNPLTGLTSLQKWMFGGQGGLDWEFDNQDTLKVGAAYYDYQGIKGQVNNSTADNSCANSSASVTQSAPQYIQGGNSMIGLCNVTNNGIGTTGVTTSPGLYGLASDYRILDINALYDFALFSPIHLKVSADFAKNLGYNATQTYAANAVNAIGTQSYIPPANQTTAWQVRFDLGWPRVDIAGNWNVNAVYRYLQADAVLSSYTDSDFHLGFTNIKGWMLAGNYGLMKNVWLSGRWMSADMITGPTYSMDIMQLDINTHF